MHTFVKPTGEHKHLEPAIIIQSQLNEAYSYGIIWMHIGPGIFYELTSHFNGCQKEPTPCHCLKPAANRSSRTVRTWA